MPFLAPVFAAIGWKAVGSFALKLGGSLLLSAAASALQKKPSFAASGASGASQIAGRDVTVREAVAAFEMVYGRSRKGGVITFVHTTPAPGSPMCILTTCAGRSGPGLCSAGSVSSGSRRCCDMRMCVSLPPSMPTCDRVTSRTPPPPSTTPETGNKLHVRTSRSVPPISTTLRTAR
jgi:hypothetical protein